MKANRIKKNLCPIFSLFILLPVLLLFNQSLSAQEMPRLLETNQPIIAEIGGRTLHEYKIHLEAQQYAKIAVTKIGIDVAFLVKVNLDGKSLAVGNTAVTKEGVGTDDLIVETAGDYKVFVIAANPQAPAGKYKIELMEKRTATELDKKRASAKSLMVEANTLYNKGQQDTYLKALEKFQEVLPLWIELGEQEREAFTLNRIGFIYFLFGEYEKAIENHKKALVLYVKTDEDRTATTLDMIGASNIKLGEPHLALKYFTQALEIYRRLNNKNGEAVILNRLGRTYEDLNEPQKSLENYTASIKLSKETNDKDTEASTLNAQAFIYRKLGRYQDSIDAYMKALELFREEKDKESEAGVLYRLSDLYLILGDVDKAIELNSQSLEIYKQTGNKKGEINSLEVGAFIFTKQGNYQKALENFLKAHEIIRSLNQKDDEADVLVYIGRTYWLLGNAQKALEYLQQGLELSRIVKDRIIEGSALFLLGEITYLNGDSAKSLEFYTQALEIYRLQNIKSYEADTLKGIARAHKSMGNLDEALINIEAAINIIESIRASLASEQYRTSLLASEYRVYEFYIDLLMQLHKKNPSHGFDMKALQAKERSIARSLFELLQETNTNIRQGVDAKLLEQERILRQLINAKDLRLRQLRLEKKDAKQIESIEKELQKLLADLKDAEAKIRANSPQYAAITQLQTIGLKEIQRLLDKDTILLEYSLGADRSFLWLVSQDGIKSYELPKRAEIEEAARKVYELLQSGKPKDGESVNQYRARLDKLTEDYWKAASGLSVMILGKAISEMGNKRLLIVPDGALHFIPFSALPGRNPKTQSLESENLALNTRYTSLPLMAEHEIVNLPSASVLSLLRKETEERRKPAPKLIAAIADPVFETDDPRIAKALQSNANTKKPKIKDVELVMREAGFDDSGGELGRLLMTRLEAESIVSLAGQNNTLKAFDFRASRQIMMSAELSQYQIIHIATHGLINSRHPELSSIVLSLYDEKGNAVDGLLRLHEIYNLKLPAELIVLSACQTGLGKEIKGEGLIGLTRGFMYAGASRVMVSLWSVQDEATQELMKRFYQNLLQKKMRPAAALRTAQLEMFHTKRWSPYHWGAFILQGEWK